MRPAIATVLTAAAWEPRLVDFARQSATLRVVRRCRTAADVDSVLSRVDAVVIGSETPWLSSPLLRRWKSHGTTILGIAASADRPGRRMFEEASADDVLSATIEPSRILTALAAVDAALPTRSPLHPLMSVTGPRGAPGRSEVALALAWAAGERVRTVLIEMDADAPGLGLRLGLGPANVRSGHSPRRPVGPIELVTMPPHGGPMSRSLGTRLVEIARSEFDAVIVDLGPPAPERIGFDPGRWIVVVEPTPNGLVRAGRLVSTWIGPTPIVVANRVPTGPDQETALKLVRAATGLEPAASIPPLEMYPDLPHPVMTAMLEPLIRSLLGQDQRRAAR